jgi:hypothetical protein
MKKLIILVTVCILLPLFKLHGGNVLSFPLLNTGDSCLFGPRIWLMDNDGDSKFDVLLYNGCNNKAISFKFIDKSNNIPSIDEKAVLNIGDIFSNYFLIYLLTPINSTYTHRIYYDSQNGFTIMEDYSSGDNQTINNEEADEYFFIRLIGSELLISKKKDIDVLSVMLCNMEGMVLFNLPYTSGWSEFVFDLYQQPSGMYFVRFIASDKILMKKVIYIR